MARNKADFVALDIETTGLDPVVDQILEIGLVKYEDGIFSEYHSFVEIEGPIPLRVKKLTGITESDLTEAPLLEDIFNEVLNFMGDLPIVGHNVDFDLSFLIGKSGYSILNSSFDTYELSQLIYPLAGSFQLAKLAKKLSFDFPQHHRALADAKMSAKVFLKILSELELLEIEFVMQVNKFTLNHSWRHKQLFSMLEKEKLRCFPGSKITGKFAFLKPLNFEDNNLFNVPKKHNNTIEKLDASFLENLVGAEGIFKESFPNYEDRPQQREMLKSVAEAFNGDLHLVVEAGTGTGKSLAYLIPALFWSVKNREPVVVATHTINLQEQLWNKDLPQLQKLLDLEFKAALVKGRSNYLCLRKWEQFMEGHINFTEKELQFYLRLIFWLKETNSGDRSELNFNYNQLELWHSVAGDAESCLGARCPWHKNFCFLMRARREAENANLLIVNHSLLLSDIKTENSILPSFLHLIIDEAHHLEDGATEHLGLQFSFSSFFGYLNSLYSSSQKGSPGFIRNFKMRMSKVEEKLSADDGKELNKQLDEAQENIFKLKEYGQVFFTLLCQVAGKGQKGSEHSYTFRIRNEERGTMDWGAVISVYENFALRLKMLQDNLRKASQLLEPLGESFIVDAKDCLNHGDFCQGLIDTLDFIIRDTQENFVYWIEIEEKVDWMNCTLKVAPIKVSQILYEEIFATKRSVILTSATVTIDDTFDYFLERTGISLVGENRVLVKQLQSPFDYEKQVLICVPKDIPSPLAVPVEVYSEEIAPFIKQVAELYQGKTLILFTSHRMLKDIYKLLKDDLEQKGICVLGHNIDGGRSKLIEEFLDTDKCVLLGASSFWEGVDLPGKNLQCVIIVKLPFWAPTIPTVEARLEDLDMDTHNSFRGFSIPQAIIRFKQGFGRLIRSTQDEGTVIILDKRIIDKSYGQKFFNSLPVKNHFRGEKEVILKKIFQWSQGQRPQFSNLVNSTNLLKATLRRKKEILKQS